jgi:hypothetical protein
MVVYLAHTLFELHINQSIADGQITACSPRLLLTVGYYPVEKASGRD